MRQEFVVIVTPPEDAEISIESRLIREKRGGLWIVHEKIKQTEIKDKDIKMDVYRSSTCVNENGCAVRLTHMPTGTVVTCNKHRSIPANYKMAINMLKVKLYDAKHTKAPEIYHDRPAMFLSINGIEIGEMVSVKPIKGT